MSEKEKDYFKKYKDSFAAQVFNSMTEESLTTEFTKNFSKTVFSIDDKHHDMGPTFEKVACASSNLFLAELVISKYAEAYKACNKINDSGEEKSDFSHNNSWMYKIALRNPHFKEIFKILKKNNLINKFTSIFESNMESDYEATGNIKESIYFVVQNLPSNFFDQKKKMSFFYQTFHSLSKEKNYEFGFYSKFLMYMSLEETSLAKIKEMSFEQFKSVVEDDFIFNFKSKMQNVDAKEIDYTVEHMVHQNIFSNPEIGLFMFDWVANNDMLENRKSFKYNFIEWLIENKKMDEAYNVGIKINFSENEKIGNCRNEKIVFNEIFEKMWKPDLKNLKAETFFNYLQAATGARKGLGTIPVSWKMEKKIELFLDAHQINMKANDVLEKMNTKPGRVEMLEIFRRFDEKNFIHQELKEPQPEKTSKAIKTL